VSDGAPEDEASPEPAEPSEAPVAEKPRRKKKRKPRQETAPEPVAAAADARDDLPAFARAFPHDAALDALVLAFEHGDYARVRREAPALARSTESDEVRAAARELARRLDPDPLAVYLLGAAAALLVFLSGWYWLHPHTP
jgi:hypothetical protein